MIQHEKRRFINGFIMSAEGTLTSGYGPRLGEFDFGIDIAIEQGLTVGTI
jgi:hypothetical protein